MQSAAIVLGISRHTVRAWIDDHRIIQRYRVTPTGRTLIPVSEVQRIKQERERRIDYTEYTD